MITNALPELLAPLAVLTAAGAAIIRRRRQPAAVLPEPASGTSFAQILSDVSLLVVLLDLDGRIVFANDRLAQLTGWSRHELTGREWDSTFGSGMVDYRRRLSTLTTATGPVGEAENVLATRSGEHRVVSWSDTLTVDAAGKPTGIGRIGADITTRRHAEDRIAFLASYDELTGLPNRALFCDWVDLAVRESSRYSRTVGVLLIDIDNFKLVNESFGHMAADEILKQFSHRLRDAALGAELVARHTGDEFLVLLADTDTPDGSEGTHDHPADVAQMAEAVAGRMRYLLRIPFLCMGDEVYLTVSVGSALFPRDAATRDDVLAQARLAIGRQRMLDGAARALDLGRLPPRQEINLVSRLHRAIESEQFILRYQPVVELGSGRIRGAEALIRWQPPDGPEVVTGGVHPAGRAERPDRADHDLGGGSGVPPARGVAGARHRHRAGIQPAGHAVGAGCHPKRASGDPKPWHRPARPARGDHRVNRDAPDSRQRGCAAHDRIGRPAARAGRLRHRPLVAGAAKQMPATTLKIDRSFVRDLPGDDESAALVVTIVQLARNLGMAPLAEGIETEAQWRFLRDAGLLLGQGLPVLEGGRSRRGRAAVGRAPPGSGGVAPRDHPYCAVRGISRSPFR